MCELDVVWNYHSTNFVLSLSMNKLTANGAKHLVRSAPPPPKKWEVKGRDFLDLKGHFTMKMMCEHSETCLEWFLRSKLIGLKKKVKVSSSILSYSMHFKLIL